jgi:type IV pilus assembly protein PilP
MTAMNTSHTRIAAIAKRFRTGCVLALVSTLLSALAGCSGDDQTELKAWMKQQRDKTPATIVPVTPPLPFVPAPYTQSLASDPFDELKLKNVLAKLKVVANTGAPKPDIGRKREALEAFPLDNMKMTGFVLKQGRPSALVAASGVLYTIVVGQHIGPDFGKVTAVSEQEITIKELVQDASGVWTERISKLPLAVAAKEIKK